LPSLKIRQKEKEKKIKKIIAWVRNYRKKHSIKTTPGLKYELSCIGFGEGYNLLFRQLVTTPIGKNGWHEIYGDESGEVIELVLQEMKKYELN